MSVINTNVMSLNAQRNLYKTGLDLQTAMQRQGRRGGAGDCGAHDLGHSWHDRGGAQRQ